MATNRFLRLKDGSLSEERINKMLQEYLGEAGTVRYDGNRWFCTLSGMPRHPFAERPEGMFADERGFEVVWVDDTLDVITRFTDPFTNAVADGFVRGLIDFFGAELKP